VVGQVAVLVDESADGAGVPRGDPVNEAFEAGSKPGVDVVDDAVAARVHDAGVESVVGPGVGQQVSGGGGIRLGLDQRAQIGVDGVANVWALAENLHGLGLEEGTHLQQLGGLDVVHGGDHRALLGEKPQQTGGFQREECFPHRGTAETQGRRDLALGEEGARGQVSGDDRVGHVGVRAPGGGGTGTRSGRGCRLHAASVAPSRVDKCINNYNSARSGPSVRVRPPSRVQTP
jgi:hypothetical protein